ncbi:hypothetical protein ES703_112740 [subsurface metagenome]
MRVSASRVLAAERITVSYRGPGWLPVDDVCAWDLKPGKKSSILRRVMKELSLLEGLGLKKKSERLGKIRHRVRKKGTDDLWHGALSPGEDEKRHYFLNCGVFGKREQDREGETRDSVYRCKQYSKCPSCKVAYHNGRAMDVANRFAAVIEAQKIKYLRKGVFTLPDNIRDQIKTNKQASGFRARIAEVINRHYGCGKDRKGAYRNGRIGMRIQTHLFSSHEPFKDGVHFHAAWLAALLTDGKVENVDHALKEFDLLWFRREWGSEAKKEAIKQGLVGAEDMPDELNIKMSWVPALYNLAKFGQARLGLRYDERSQLEDVEDCIKAVDLEKETLLMRFQQDKWDYFALWSIDDYMAVQGKMLAVKGETSSYGWMRRFESYAPDLGVKVERDIDAFTPLPELTERIQFKRYYDSRWNKVKRRAEIVKALYVRTLKDPNNPGAWVEVDSGAVRGEDILIKAKKRYLYGVATQSGVGDRGS